MTDDEPLVSTAEAARELRVDRSTLSRWARSGQVTPADKTLGGHMKWRVSELREQIRTIIEQSG